MTGTTWRGLVVYIYMPRAPLRRPGPALEVFVAHLSGDLLQLENELAV